MWISPHHYPHWSYQRTIRGLSLCSFSSHTFPFPLTYHPLANTPFSELFSNSSPTPPPCTTSPTYAFPSSNEFITCMASRVTGSSLTPPSSLTHFPASVHAVSPAPTSPSPPSSQAPIIIPITSPTPLPALHLLLSLSFLVHQSNRMLLGWPICGAPLRHQTQSHAILTLPLIYYICLFGLSLHRGLLDYLKHNFHPHMYTKHMQHDTHTHAYIT